MDILQPALPHYHRDSYEYHHMKYRISLFKRGIKYYTEKSKEWKKNHPDKVKESWLKYCHKKEVVEKRKSHYWQNKNEINAKRKELREQNNEKIKKEKREYYQRNKERIKQKTKKYYETWKNYNKYQTVFHYSNGKVCCGACGLNIIELLTIDHINGGGSKHRKEIGSKNIYVWLRKHGYPEGYQVLCYNCNLIKEKVSEERYNEIVNELRYRQLSSELSHV